MRGSATAQGRQGGWDAAPDEPAHQGTPTDTHATGTGSILPEPAPVPPGTTPPGRPYRTSGATTSANAARARLSRLFTVPRFTPVISAISSYDFPSSSRSTNTSR